MNTQQFAKLFPLGSHLCREPMPAMSELKRDMENLKRHGFNLVKLQEQWAADEPREGHYDFSRYEELIEHAARLDMGVYLGLTCEQAPGWLWRLFPDCRMVGRNGLPIVYQAQTPLPADGKPGPCYDHVGAMQAQTRFITKLVSTLGKYENVVVWNTWQEVAYWADGIVGQPVCYCEHTLQAFRRWLRERYADLDGLNRAWNMRYGGWEDVLPNRHAARSCCPQDIDWGYFQDNVRPAYTLSARAEAIRAADPYGRPVFAHKAQATIGSGQDWAYARCQDFLGSSAYPAWGALDKWDDGYPGGGRYERHTALVSELWNGVALKYDYIRSSNPSGAPVWAAEFQGGPVSTSFHKGRVPSAQDIRRWMLTAVGSGVTAISFWVTRAEIAADELNGFGLLDSEGDTTPRFEAAAVIGQALNRHADLFAQPAWPGAEVAIVVDESNYQVCALLGRAAEHLPYSVRGWHRLLWDAGIPVDFIAASQLDPQQVNRYKVLILAFPLSMSEQVAQQLARYVEQGSTLISDACPGRVSEHGFANRGELSPAMRALFGVRQNGLAMVREPGGEMRWSPPERTWGEYLDATMLAGYGPLAGESLRANVYIETFERDDSQPCLMYGGDIAGVVRQVGQGQAWLLGTFAGHGGTAYRDEQSLNCISRLLSQCGVSAQRQGRLLLRKRVIPGKQAWIFTNPNAEDVTELIELDGWQVEDLLGEPLRQEGGVVHLLVRGLDVRVLVLSR
ncbi:MAG: beta-galactosidase [Chloroflexi bacterium]|nr:beta-galactosidase [Chloroflexota bacterium]